jgi:hypothetical protein
MKGAKVTGGLGAWKSWGGWGEGRSVVGPHRLLDCQSLLQSSNLTVGIAAPAIAAVPPAIAHTQSLLMHDFAYTNEY